MILSLAVVKADLDLMMALMWKMTDLEHRKRMQDLGLLQIHLTQTVIVMEWMMMIADHRPESIQVEMLLQPEAAAL